MVWVALLLRAVRGGLAKHLRGNKFMQVVILGLQQKAVQYEFTLIWNNFLILHSSHAIFEIGNNVVLLIHFQFGANRVHRLHDECQLSFDSKNFSLLAFTHPDATTVNGGSSGVKLYKLPLQHPRHKNVACLLPYWLKEPFLTCWYSCCR